MCMHPETKGHHELSGLPHYTVRDVALYPRLLSQFLNKRFVKTHVEAKS